jgi:hypothetical protein
MMITAKKNSRTAGIARFLFRIQMAWGAGVGIYMLAMAMTVYDGILSLIIQPFLAALFSFVFLIVVLLAGVLLRIPPVRRLWQEHSAVALSVLLVGIVLLIGAFASIEIMVNSADRQIVEASGRVAVATIISGTLLVMFAIANWPPEVGIRRILPHRTSAPGGTKPNSRAEAW